MGQKEFKIEFGGRDLIVKVGDLAELANGSCLLQYGNTSVLATVVMGEEKENLDYFPLVVNYEERYYAAGKILGSRYIRREGRPSDEAILTARLIDRAIRPRFPENLRRAVQVIITCLSWDEENDPDVIGLLAASISLLISDVPWSGPVMPLRVGEKDGKFIPNPTYIEREKSSLDLTLSALKDKEDFLINMIEAEGNEIEKEKVISAINWAKPYFETLYNFQNQIKEKEGREKIKIETKPIDPKLENKIKKFLGDRLEKAIFKEKKENRMEQIKEIKEALLEYIEKEFPDLEDESLVKIIFEKEVKNFFRQKILSEEKRPDGRKLDQIRNLRCQVGLLPRTHGSGLFSRGETKTLSILTLGAPGDVKLLEGMEYIGEKRFMHHYNFPPYSVGEVRPIRGPGRREIGHGMLVEKALRPVVPSSEDFPYTIRIVSEILSSNGSTSMGSVCSSSLALMDAGVPIKRPVAGIAIGLVSENRNYKILTDIQGPEDHYGDMDLKVAGTQEGITALQMDLKIKGVSIEIIKEALLRAKKARIQILNEIKKAISAPRKKLSPYAPKIFTLQIEPEKIGEVIGPGGSVIKKIIDQYGVAIDIEESGKIYVTSDSEEAGKKAISLIKNITREIKVGEVFQGKVIKILPDFGAIVEILPGQKGLIHISKLAPRRIKSVKEVVKVGDIVQVRVVSIDEQGRIN
ncbi:polyribonucleotide nucleotidyltransferase, partial [bacterium]|nr:polyribonucleotide nucleotidyltransferase [bacterium]